MNKGYYQLTTRPYQPLMTGAMALRSMTAYGRATLEEEGASFTVELQSINRKHLELNVHLPPEIGCFDADVRKWISAYLSRGQVSIRVNVAFSHQTPLTIKPNLAHAAQLKQAWELIATTLGLPLDDSLKMHLIAQDQELISYENTAHDNQSLRAALQRVVNHAVSKLIAMKVVEGAALHDDITARLALLLKSIARVEELAPGAIQRYQEKLRGKLAEILPEHLEVDERLLREVPIYAERVDISEEILRFKSHLKQFNDHLDDSATDIGKTLDFLIQELKREINTIGSKSDDLEIVQLVVDMKGELERIREQIQNVE